MPRGERRLPDACVERLRAADLILHAGDVSTATELDALRSLGPPVQAVYGNADEWELRETLPRQLVVEVAGARIGLVHIPGPGAGREARLLGRFPDCGAVVFGHTHMPQIVRHEGVWLLNPGSPTERRRARHRSMLLLRVEAGEIDPELVVLKQV